MADGAEERSSLRAAEVDETIAQAAPSGDEMRAAIRDNLAHVPHEVSGHGLGDVARRFFASWLAMRGSKPMPTADDIRPRFIADLLPHLHYANWEDDDRLVCRVWGGALVDATQVNLAGRNMLDLVPRDCRTKEAYALRMLHQQPCGVLHHRHVRGDLGMERLFEVLTLPVAPGIDGKLRLIGTGVLLPGRVGTDLDPIPEGKVGFHEMAFIDVGFGVPEA